MAVVFVLGPSLWEDPQPDLSARTPMRVRVELVDLLLKEGHEAFLMEDVPDEEDEDMVDKFERLVSQMDVTDILVYWPPRAKMQTTHDELIILRALHDVLPIPTIWLLHHEEVAKVSAGEFKALEKGNRSRYLTAVAKLGVRPFPWRDEEELLRIVRLLARHELA